MAYKSNIEQLAEDIESGKIQKLKKEDNFEFKCDSCGSCCRNRNDIILSPHDVFKLVKYLDITTKEFMNKYINYNIGEHSGWTIITLKYKEKLDNSTFCPFLKASEGKFLCRVHSSKPYVCVAFPLGRTVAIDRKTNKITDIEYILQDVHCGNKEEIQNVGNWLRGEQNIESEEFFKKYNLLISEVNAILNLPKFDKNKKINDDIKTMFYNSLMLLLYYGYDVKQPFMVQFGMHYESILKMIKEYKELVEENLKIKLV